MTPIKLYNKSRTGAVRYWQIHRVKDTLFIKYGQEGGKATATTYIGKVRNSGKSNEVSSEDDAENEMNRLILSKKRKGYANSLSTASVDVMSCPLKLRFYKRLPL